MDHQRVAQAIDDLRRDRAEAEQEMRVAERRVAAIDRILDGYREAYPDMPVVPSAPTADRPGTQDALLAVLSDEDDRGRFWTVPAVAAEMEARSWLPPDSKDPASAVRAALARLPLSHPEVVYKGTGEHGRLVYYYRHPDMPPPRFHGEEGDRTAERLSASKAMDQRIRSLAVERLNDTTEGAQREAERQQTGAVAFTAAGEVAPR